jgi:Flp pilus assembly protein TadG
MIPMTTHSRLKDDRGAIIIHVAIALLALIAFSAFVVDMGVMWVSRGQAQNAADAAALAGGVALMNDGGSTAEAANSTFQWANNNAIFGAPNSAANVRVTFSGPSGTCGPFCVVTSIPPCLTQSGCVRVDVFRNTPSRGGTTLGAPVPTFLGPVVGITQQGVRATATAQVAAGGNSVKCLLPFAAIDRWADDFDENKDGTYFKDDPLSGTAGWSPNDIFQPTASPSDVYIGPYAGNTNHTGWTVAKDFGRQLVLKDGSTGSYSAGWALTIDLPDSTGSHDYNWNIQNCNSQPVGIAKQPELCTAVSEPIGCMSVKTGIAQGPTSQGIGDLTKGLVGQDPSAHWDSIQKTIVGGQGMSSPRIRPMVVLDMNNYISQGCSGTTCIGKVANIIGFFAEGMCKDVTLDPGMGCDDKTKDVVGRIVTIPGAYATGTGSVEETASFIKVLRLVR